MNIDNDEDIACEDMVGIIIKVSRTQRGICSRDCSIQDKLELSHWMAGRGRPVGEAWRNRYWFCL